MLYEYISRTMFLYSYTSIVQKSRYRGRDFISGGASLLHLFIFSSFLIYEYSQVPIRLTHTSIYVRLNAKPQSDHQYLTVRSSDNSTSTTGSVLRCLSCPRRLAVLHSTLLLCTRVAPLGTRDKSLQDERKEKKERVALMPQRCI